VSDYRAIAAATQTLQNLLLEAIREAVPGATVKTGPPEVRPPEEVGEGLINIFLYKMEPNKVWRNEELPVRSSDGTLLRRPLLALDIHYLLSFYGEERRKIPYLLLGLALSALHAEPYPALRHIPHEVPAGASGEPASTDPVAAGLAGSGLERQSHPLSFTLLPLHHEELVPLFSQIPYVMSVAYRASVLTIEPFGVPQPSLPVRRAELHLIDARRPVLAAVEPQLLPYNPEAVVRLRGEGLAGPAVRVLFGELEAQPSEVAAGELRAPLPVGLQAGTHLVRVAQTATAEGSPGRSWTLESNPVALVVEPVVLEAVQVPGPVSVEPALAGNSAGAADGAARSRPPATLRIRFGPPVAVSTPLLLLLNERAETSGAARPPRSYAFQSAADPRSPDTALITAEIEPGSYLVRVRVNGVTSRLQVDADPASPTFNRYDAPRLEVRREGTAS
jgi:hypothetical protein